MLRRFAGASNVLEPDDNAHPGPPLIDESHFVAGLRQLISGRHRPMVASALLLWRSGVETRGVAMEDIQRALRA